MKSARFGVAVFAAGLAVALALFAYLLDQARAGAHVTPGLGEAAEPEREQALAVPENEDDGEGAEGLAAEPRSGRRAVPSVPPETSALVVSAVDENGRRLIFPTVLAYRGSELLRACRTLTGTANLIPFEGPGSLRIEHDGFEIARLEIPEGRGRYDVVVPRLPCVSGVVRVGGVPRLGVRVELVEGSDAWLATWIARELETAGLGERNKPFSKSTDDDGTFRFEWLAPGWSGVLRLDDENDWRLANGAKKIDLERPEEGLVLDVEPVHPEVEFRGRVVFASRPVPGARWALAHSGNSGRCDGSGRFSIFVFENQRKGLRVEFSDPGLGRRSVELGEPGMPSDLGEVELQPTRNVAFVVRSKSGAPIAGARATPRMQPELCDLDLFGVLKRASKPTDSAGRGLLESLHSDEKAIRVRSCGYELTDALVPDDSTEQIPVVLTPCAACEVVVRDRSGRIPRGVRVRLVAAGPAFTWDNGYFPDGDEMMDGVPFGNMTNEGVGFTMEYLPDTRGRVWIEPLRAGVPFDLSAVDAYGTRLDGARGVAVAPGEWRRIDLRVEAEPRTLVVMVRDTLGHPLEHARVDVLPAGVLEPRYVPPVNSWAALNPDTDPAGMLRTEPLYGSDLTLRVSREGFESRTLEHVSIPREGATIEVRLAHDWFPW